MVEKLSIFHFSFFMWLKGFSSPMLVA